MHDEHDECSVINCFGDAEVIYQHTPVCLACRDAIIADESDQGSPEEGDAWREEQNDRWFHSQWSD